MSARSNCLAATCASACSAILAIAQRAFPRLNPALDLGGHLRNLAFACVTLGEIPRGFARFVQPVRIEKLPDPLRAAPHRLAALVRCECVLELILQIEQCRLVFKLAECGPDRLQRLGEFSLRPQLLSVPDGFFDGALAFPRRFLLLDRLLARGKRLITRPTPQAACQRAQGSVELTGIYVCVRFPQGGFHFPCTPEGNRAGRCLVQ